MNRISSERIRAFVAGGFTLMFFKGFIQGICELIASAAAGKFLWPLLVVEVFSVLGIVLGVALLIGRSWALVMVRVFLGLVVAGEILSLIMPLLHVWPSEGWKSVTDLIADATMLILLGWKTSNTAPKPPA